MNSTPAAAVSTADTIAFLEGAFRNIRLPKLSEEDLDEVREQLGRMVSERAAGVGERERKLLSPDAEDIRLLRDGVLPGCPCCGGTPTTFARHFPHSGIYQGYVKCSRCDVEVFKNAHDLDEARGLAIAAWSRRPVASPLAPADARKCAASPDRADILETIENAAEDWQRKGYATALAEVRDMANVGRALMEALPEGYHYNDCPSEIVSDLQNQLAEAAPEDASGEAEPSRLVRGLQDVWEEIDRLNERCFGAGSEASVSVRTSDLTEVIDVIRDNLPRNPAAGL